MGLAAGNTPQKSPWTLTIQHLFHTHQVSKKATKKENSPIVSGSTEYSQRSKMSPSLRILLSPPKGAFSSCRKQMLPYHCLFSRCALTLPILCNHLVCIFVQDCSC